MMTVKEVSDLTGVSIRTLQYYDKIGLLKPTEYTASGYRLYDDTALDKLQQILLFRELEFPLKEIKDILTRPDYNRKKALEAQITLLTMKKEHLENLILFARGIQLIGVKTMDFSVFDTSKIDEYAKRAKEQFEKTAEYQEFAQKAKNRTKEEDKIGMELCMQLFTEFGKLKSGKAEADEAQMQVKKLQDFITEYFYRCSDEMLLRLGHMYAGCGEFTDNIDRAGGAGTAQFVLDAIQVYCGKS